MSNDSVDEAADESVYRSLEYSGDSSINLHVALITPWETGGGIANYSERLRDALEDAGVSVTVVPIRYPETANPLRFDETIAEIPPNADVIHVQYEAGVFGRFGVSGICTPSFYARVARCDQPVVTTFHEVHQSCLDNNTVGEAIVSARDWIVERIALAVSEAVIVHTDDVVDILQTRHGDHWTLLKLRHPVDDVVTPPVDSETARETMDIDADIVLTTFGWVESKKQYSDVVQALTDLSDTTYLIAGEPRYKRDEAVLADVFELAERLGVRDRVRHIGYVAEDDLPILFGATDLAVVPYEQVTQSGAVNTSLAYRCPVIATALPAFEELAADYDCVLTYDHPDTLVTIVRKATTADARERLRKSVDRYNNTETWFSFANETAAFYTSIINTH
jgi:glycosyltransferase involved in cell wall biosynthesis